MPKRTTPSEGESEDESPEVRAQKYGEEPIDGPAPEEEEEEEENPEVPLHNVPPQGQGPQNPPPLRGHIPARPPLRHPQPPVPRPAVMPGHNIRPPQIVIRAQEPLVHQAGHEGMAQPLIQYGILDPEFFLPPQQHVDAPNGVAAPVALGHGNNRGQRGGNIRGNGRGHGALPLGRGQQGIGRGHFDNMNLVEPIDDNEDVQGGVQVALQDDFNQNL